MDLITMPDSAGKRYWMNDFWIGSDLRFMLIGNEKTYKLMNKDNGIIVTKFDIKKGLSAFNLALFGYSSAKFCGRFTHVRTVKSAKISGIFKPKLQCYGFNGFRRKNKFTVRF